MRGGERRSSVPQASRRSDKMLGGAVLQGGV